MVQALTCTRVCVHSHVQTQANAEHLCKRSPLKNNQVGREGDTLFIGIVFYLMQIKTESQNHGMAGVGRALWGSPSPTPLPKQGHPEQAAQHRGQAGLEYLQRRRLHSLLGQPVPGLRHPQREEVLPHVQLELPLLQFVPVAPYPVAEHH